MQFFVIIFFESAYEPRDIRDFHVWDAKLNDPRRLNLGSDHRNVDLCLAVIYSMFK